MFLPKKGAAAKILEKRGSSEIPLAVPGRFEINVLSSFTGRIERAFFFARPGAADCFFHNTLISKFCAETQSGQSLARAFNPVSEHVKKSSAMQGGGFFIFGPQIASCGVFYFFSMETL